MSVEPSRAPARTRRSWSRGAGALAAVAALGSKVKVVLGLLLKLKLFVSLGSMLVSALAYGLVYGWAFGVGVTALIALHELGHVVAIRRQGLAAGLPVFIPFLGAGIFLRQRPLSAWHEFQVAAAGPLAGVAASALALALARTTSQPVFASLAYVGFFLQLFNLIPVSPLDGGRMVAAVSHRLWWLGLLVLAVAVVALHSALALVIGVLVLFQFWQRRRRPEGDAYFALPPRQRWAAFLAWAGLVLASAAGMAAVERLLSP